MSLASVTGLNDAIQADQARRKKEITNLSLLLARQRASTMKDALRRASVCMLYAHWEGESAVHNYYEHVRLQGLAMGKLKPCFRALNLFGQARAIATTKKIRPITDMISKVDKCLTEPMR